jgi:hypothetical protein
MRLLVLTIFCAAHFGGLPVFDAKLAASATSERRPLTPALVPGGEKGDASEDRRSSGVASTPAGEAPGSVVLLAQTQSNDIDWERARQLYQRSQQGTALSADDNAYLERAKEARRKLAAKGQRGVPMPGPPRNSTGLVPLDELTGTYKGEDGGLYGGGRNQPPSKHQTAAEVELARVVPRDSEGQPSHRGRIVLLSIGMSNTTQEFSRFKQIADPDLEKSGAVQIVDGAQGGKDAAAWSDERAGAAVWNIVADRLRQAGVTPQQVQVVWMKHARIGPARFGEFPKHIDELKAHIRGSLQIVKRRFPNLRIVYLSSRIYAGYATTPLNPEPYAYEGAFAVRSLILDQAHGDGELNYDAAKDNVKAPLLLWGPYLWADGVNPRKSDGLLWNREDLAVDGTHPSVGSGRDKVARLLLRFFKTDRNATNWFLQPAPVLR